MKTTKAMAIFCILLFLLVSVVYAALRNPDSDLDGDGDVDIFDLALFAHVFGKSVAKGDFVIGDRSYADKADLNDDGVVNIMDLAIFARDFSAGSSDRLSINIVSPVHGSTINNNSAMLNLTTNVYAVCSYSAYVQTGQQGKINLHETSGTIHSQLVTNLENRKSYLINIECEDNEGNKAMKAVSFNTDFKVIEGFLTLATKEDYYPTDRVVELTDPPLEQERYGGVITRGGNRGELVLSPTGEGYTLREALEREGFIVQFKSAPLLAKYLDLRDSAEDNEKSMFRPFYQFLDGVFPASAPSLSSNIDARLIDYRNALSNQRTQSKEDIKRKLRGGNQITGGVVGISRNDLRVMQEFTEVFNGIVLDISSAEANEIKKLSYVKDVYPNYKVHVTLDKSVPVIKGDKAREYFGVDGEGVTIAIIDTGIDPIHKSLDDLDDNPKTNDSKIIAFKDFINFRLESYDDHGHGTHVAGIAAGTGGGSEYKGVAPNAKLVGVKVLDEGGSGTFSQVLAGVEWAVQNKDKYGIKVISMSLGADINSDGTTPIEQAVDLAVDYGINVVVAAGNSGPQQNTVGIPASAKKIITVGAVDNNMEIAGFSSRGPTKDGRIKPEVSAPGVGICSAQWDDAWNYRECTDPDFVALSGTSMATPHVAGVAALLLDANPSLTPPELRLLLMNTSVDKGEPGPDNTYGWGVVDTLETMIKIKPPQHDLGLYNLEMPRWVSPNNEANINLILRNNGLNNEAGVIVKLMVGDVEVNSTIVSSISSKNSVSLSFKWKSSEEGDYKIKVVANRLQGEDILANNEISKNIKVVYSAGTIKAVILDSWCSNFMQYCNLDEVSESWYSYGNYTVQIENLNKRDITYEDLVSSGADVLIVSDAWVNRAWPGRWEFTDAEIDAIKRYVNEGHGIIATSGTFSEEVPNNMKLAPLFGIDSSKIGVWASWDIYFKNSEFDISYLEHLLFNKLELPYRSGSRITVLDLQLDSVKPGMILAKSLDKKASIFAYKNSFYFTHMPEYSSYEGDMQLFYNAILEAAKPYTEVEYNLELSDLTAERIMGYDKPNSINATLKNKGRNAQSNIKVRFFVDDEQLETFTISSLNSGESRKISFVWAPSEVASHKIKISADRLPQESIIFDNSLTKQVIVPGASFTDIYRDYGVDTDNDGFYDYLALDVGLDVVKSAYYHLRFDLYSLFGVQIKSVYGGTELYAGKRNISLKIDGLQLRKFGLNGPYKIKDLVLSSENGDIGIREEPHITYNYSYENFETAADLMIVDIRIPKEIVVNQSKDLIVTLENRGAEVARDTELSLYERKGDTLLELLKREIIGKVGVSESKEVNITLRFDSVGGKDLLLQVNASNEYNAEDSSGYIYLEVIPNGPDVRGFFYIDRSKKIIVNKETMIKTKVKNNGLEKAENVVATLYKREIQNDQEALTLIGTLSMDSLDKGNERGALFNWTPTKVGYQELKLVVNSTNDGNLDNNFEYINVEIFADGPDVVGYLGRKEKVIVNQPNEIEASIYNKGTQRALNAVASLYKVDYQSGEILTLIDTKNIGSLDEDENKQIIFSWVPDRIGSSQLKLLVNCTGDSNLDNNMDTSKSFRVTKRSMIKNTGTVNITGYLLMKIQKNMSVKSGTEEWTDYAVIVNETIARTILRDRYIPLDVIWNNYNVKISEGGSYRVYGAFVDGSGNVIQSYGGRPLSEVYPFKVG